MFDWAPLLEPFPNWAHLVCCSEQNIDNGVRHKLYEDLSETAPMVRFIRASHCATIWETYMYWSAALQVPYYFGYNAMAFDECIKDLSWLKAHGYVFVITHAETLLIDEDERALTAFLNTLREAAEAWTTLDLPAWPPDELSSYAMRGFIPFHILFQTAPENEMGTRQRYARAGVWLPTLPFTPLPRFAGMAL